MIVVAGGTGTLGTRLVPRLARRGLAVRVLTRDPARARHLAGQKVEVARGDVRDPASLTTAIHGAGTVISAVHGFAGPGGVSPARVDRDGNAHLIGAAARGGAAFILVSVAGAAPAHPIGLFRAKHAAEDTLRASGIGWSIVRATAFMETWATIMGRMLHTSGKIVVFGRGDNPVNFVSATDVAALVAHAATSPNLRGQVLEIGGPDNLTFNQVAAILQESTGRHGTVRHIPRPALQAMAWLTAGIKPELARQARAALAMDTLDMTFDPAPNRRAFPDLPNTDLPSALKELATAPHRRPNDSFACDLRPLVKDPPGRPVMNLSRFLSEPFTEPAQQDQIHPPRPVAAPLLRLDSRAPGHPEAIHREPAAELRADRSHGPGTFRVIALWLRRALADSARAWALAAGVPPDLYPPAGAIRATGQASQDAEPRISMVRGRASQDRADTLNRARRRDV